MERYGVVASNDHLMEFAPHTEESTSRTTEESTSRTVGRGVYLNFSAPAPDSDEGVCSRSTLVGRVFNPDLFSSSPEEEAGVCSTLDVCEQEARANLELAQVKLAAVSKPVFTRFPSVQEQLKSMQEFWARYSFASLTTLSVVTFLPILREYPFVALVMSAIGALLSVWSPIAEKKEGDGPQFSIGRGLKTGEVLSARQVFGCPQQKVVISGNMILFLVRQALFLKAVWVGGVCLLALNSLAHYFLRGRDASRRHHPWDPKEEPNGF